MYKSNLVFFLKALFIILFASNFNTLANQSIANDMSKPKYLCDYIDNEFRTIVETTRGKITLIRWQGINAKARCTVVSNKFQEFADNGWLRNMGVGILPDNIYESNLNRKALCVLDIKSKKCKSIESILMFFDISEDPEIIYNQLLDAGSRQNGGSVILNSDFDGTISFPRPKKKGMPSSTTGGGARNNEDQLPEPE